MQQLQQQYEFKARLDRALQQRIYLVDTTNPSPMQFNFEVMGSSGADPYNITIRRHSFISCSCPDHTKNHKLCKHLIFVLVRVLKETSELVYKSYYMRKMFVTMQHTFDNCVKFYETKDSLPGNLGGVSGAFVQGVAQRPIEETDACPICFEEFVATTKEAVVYCKASCGKSVHDGCFSKWVARDHRNADGTCVYCRAKWIV